MKKADKPKAKNFTLRRDAYLMQQVRKGTPWPAIAEVMERSEADCRKRYNLVMDRVKANISKKAVMNTAAAAAAEAKASEASVPVATASQPPNESGTSSGMILEPITVPDTITTEALGDASSGFNEGDKEVEDDLGDYVEVDSQMVLSESLIHTDTVEEEHAVEQATEMKEATEAKDAMSVSQWRVALQDTFKSTIEAIEAVTVDESQGLNMFDGLAEILERHIERLTSLHDMMKDGL